MKFNIHLVARTAFLALVLSSVTQLSAKDSIGEKSWHFLKSPYGVGSLLAAAGLSGGGAAWAHRMSKKAKTVEGRKRAVIIKKVLVALGIVTGGAAVAGGVGYFMDDRGVPLGGGSSDKVSSNVVLDAFPEGYVHSPEASRDAEWFRDKLRLATWDAATKVSLASFCGDLKQCKNDIFLGDSGLELLNGILDSIKYEDMEKRDFMRAILQSKLPVDPQIGFTLVQKKWDDCLTQLIEALRQQGSINSLVSSVNKYGYSPLCLAIKIEAHTCVMPLVDADTQWDERKKVYTPQGRRQASLWELALGNKSSETLIALVKKYHDKYGTLPRSTYAVWLPNPEISREFKVLQFDYSLLHIASFMGYASKIQVLYGLGYLVDSTEGLFGLTPLHCACLASENLEQQQDTIKLLLNKGADINKQTKFDQTPLWLAVYKKSLNAVSALLRYDASKAIDVNIFGVSGYSIISRGAEFLSLPPIFIAAKAGCWDIVEILLDKGARLAALSRPQTVLLESGESVSVYTFEYQLFLETQQGSTNKSLHDKLALVDKKVGQHRFGDSSVA